MSMYVTIADRFLHYPEGHVPEKAEAMEYIELSRIVLEVMPGGELIPTDDTFSWDEECFEADLKYLQENGVRGYVVIDFEFGMEFTRYRLQSDGVKKAAGRVYFSGDLETSLGPLMVSDEDIDSLADRGFFSEEEAAFLKENQKDISVEVGDKIMNTCFEPTLRDVCYRRLREASEEQKS